MTGLRNSVTLYNNAFDVYNTSKWSRRRRKVRIEINKKENKKREAENATGRTFPLMAPQCRKAVTHTLLDGWRRPFSFFQQHRPSNTHSHGRKNKNKKNKNKKKK